jgi:hypothetical protein
MAGPLPLIADPVQYPLALYCWTEILACRSNNTWKVEKSGKEILSKRKSRVSIFTNPASSTPQFGV